MTTAKPATLLLATTILPAIVGCGFDDWKIKLTRMELTAVNDEGVEENYFTRFQRASYRRGPAGLVELVLEAQHPSEVDPKQTITQLVYIKSYWTPIPGRTYMEATQINARVQYAMLTPPTGVRYDGSTFVSYKMKKRSGELKGRLESGNMSPKYRMGNATEPFGPARFEGTFRARENPRHVVEVLQILESQFTETIAQHSP